MRSWFFFIGGFLAGAIFMAFLFANTLSNDDSEHNFDLNSELPGAVWFESPSEKVNIKSFKVFQVLRKDMALVEENNKSLNNITYLLTNDDNKYYYDDEIINIPKNQIVRQIGIFQYESRLGQKTVPIITITEN